MPRSLLWHVMVIILMQRSLGSENNGRSEDINGLSSCIVLKRISSAENFLCVNETLGS